MGQQSSSSGLSPSVDCPGSRKLGAKPLANSWEQACTDTHRVKLGMWDRPYRKACVTKLGQAISQARDPVILVDHSLGCQAIAWWALLSPQPYGWPVAGALLVAPADVDRPNTPAEFATFTPAPRTPSPFPSILVASTNDP